MIEMILSSIAFGTVWFWIIAAIVSIIFITCVEHDTYNFPTLVAIFLGFLYGKELLSMGLSKLAIVIAIYGIIGVLYSLFRWFLHVEKKTSIYREEHGSVLTENQKYRLRNDISLSENHERIVAWIAYWPWSGIWYLSGNFFKALFDIMRNGYQRIVDRALNKFTISN